MTKSNNIGIVLSFLGLWITTYFSIEYQQITGFVIIFLFGILHGSNDLLLISKIGDNKKRLNYKKILFYYLIFVSTGIVLFYWLPGIALLTFLLVSGYHFGEQHWNTLKAEKTSITVPLFQALYGLFILTLLFYFHQQEVTAIVEQIVRFQIDTFNYEYCLWIVGTALVVQSFIVWRKSSNFKSEIVVNIVYLLLFAIIFRNSNLIWAFAIYFIVWHSLPSIKEQICFLFGYYSFQNFIRYFKAAFLYWLVSLAGILILYLVFKDEAIFNALFFSFLAAITFPHALVIMKMQNSTSEKN
jgi:Brp/Blh family beta-carotene 15,15'-monooxygenase